MLARDISAVEPPQKNTRPLVSVIITTRDRVVFLREAIESVLNAQNTTFDIELIVVNDGSTDGTPELMQQYPIKIMRTGGVGMAGARNMGLRAAQGDYVTLLDDDDVWLPNNMTPQIALLEKHPEYAAVHAQVQLTHADLTPYGSPQPPGPLSSGWLFEEMLTYFPQVGTILTRANVAREAGDFDPSLTGDNDWDWLLRIARRHQIARIEEPVLLFRQRANAYEELAWRRFPALATIFHRHTRPLGLLKRLQLRPILWRHHGWWASLFLQFVQSNYMNGDRQRAYRSLGYSFCCSPLHALIGCLRSWPFQVPRPQICTDSDSYDK